MKKASEIWNELIGRPMAQLSPPERVVARVNRLLIDFDTGSWLYNIGPQAGEGYRWVEFRQTAEAFAIVGAQDVARILTEVADIVETADIQKPGTWSEFLAEADPGNRIEALEEWLSENNDGVWDKLKAYTAEQLACETD